MIGHLFTRGDAKVGGGNRADGVVNASVAFHLARGGSVVGGSKLVWGFTLSL